MSPEEEARKLRRRIDEDRRALDDPYEQNKWVERESIEEAQRRLRQLGYGSY